MTKTTASSRSFVLGTGLRIVGWVGIATGIATTGLGLSAFVAADSWFLDNMSFFLRQLLALGFAGLMIGAIGLKSANRGARRYRGAVLFLGLALLTLAIATISRTTTITKPPVPNAVDATALRIVSVNLEGLFLEDATLKTYLEKTDADVILFQEVQWYLQLEKWKRFGGTPGVTGQAPYPDFHLMGRLGDLAIYSRFPIVNTRSVIVPGTAANKSDSAREILSATIDTGAKSIDLFVVHPASPRTERRWADRQTYVQELQSQVIDRQRKTEHPVLVAGDWNMSPWSGHFADALANMGLQTAFPDGMPQTTRFFFDYHLRWMFGAIVDHIAVPDGVEFLQVRLGPNIGSDHIPLEIDINISLP